MKHSYEKKINREILISYNTHRIDWLLCDVGVVCYFLDQILKERNIVI